MFSMIKLREKSHILLWILLFFFVASMAVGGLVGGANIMDLIFGGKNIQVHVGSIGNKNITHAQYLREREIQLNRLRRQGQEINSRAYQNAGDYAWNAIIDRELKDNKIKKLGLEVSLDEIYDFLLNTPPPAFKTDLMNAGFFKNDEEKFDEEAYKQTVENGSMPIELEPLLMNWEIYLRTWLADRKLQNLYNQLGSVTDAEVRNKYIKDSLNCTLDYIFISTNKIVDSLVSVPDEEILEYYNDNKEDNYKLKERRTLEYVLFQVPKAITAEDSLEMATVEDSVIQLARDFAVEAEYTSFKSAIKEYELNKIDTIDIHETFESNSGIPFQMGVLRDAVRFAFDNSLNSVSEPITADNGIAVFHSLAKKDEGFKPLDEVKESIRRNLSREKKLEYAKGLLQLGLNNAANWENIATNDSLIQYSKGETQKLGGTFPGIGRNNTLTGTVMAMNIDETSQIIETFNAVTILKMNAKDEVDEEKYQEAFEQIRQNLLNTERNRGYNSWLTEARKAIKKDDYRSEVY